MLVNVILRNLAHFVALLALRCSIRELCYSQTVSLELFNCESRFHCFTTKRKVCIVNSVFRFTAFISFVYFDIIQAALYCLLYGVLPGRHVRCVLAELVYIDIVCLIGQYFTVSATDLGHFWVLVRTKKLQRTKAMRVLVCSIFRHSDCMKFVQCPQVIMDLILLVMFSRASYNDLNVIHCAFVQGCYLGLKSVKPCVSAIGLLAREDKQVASILSLTESYEHVLRVSNCVLQLLILTKLTLSTSIDRYIFVYVLLLPYLFDVANMSSLFSMNQKGKDAESLKS